MVILFVLKLLSQMIKSVLGIKVTTVSSVCWQILILKKNIQKKEIIHSHNGAERRGQVWAAMKPELRFQSVPCIEPRGFSWSTQCRHTAQSRLWIVPQTWVHTDCLYCWAIPPEVGISSNHPKDCPAHLLHGRGTLNRTTSSDFLPTWGTRQFLYALKFHSRYMGHPGCSR